jgi:hypothetical protein
MFAGFRFVKPGNAYSELNTEQADALIGNMSREIARSSLLSIRPENWPDPRKFDFNFMSFRGWKSPILALSNLTFRRAQHVIPNA